MVAREHVHVTVYAKRVVVRTERVVPRATRKSQHPRRNRVRHDSTGETSAAAVIDAHHVAIGDATPYSVGGIDRDCFTACDLAPLAHGPRVHLAMQAIPRLARDEMERINAADVAPSHSFGSSQLDAADNHHSESCDEFGIKLYAPRCRGEPMAFRIGAEIREQHVFLGVLRNRNPPSCQKRSNSGMAAGCAHLLMPSIVYVAKPAHLISAFGIGGIAAEAARELAENSKIAARITHRIDRALHGDDEIIARIHNDWGRARN